MMVSTRYLLAMKTANHIHDLLDRLARLHAAGLRHDDLNPTQVAALSYLARANRFSRSPSLVADYLATTRGTASQTVKALVRKGLVEEAPVSGDKRAITLVLTASGRAAFGRNTEVMAALAMLEKAEAEILQAGLEELAKSLLSARGGRSFGLCRTCRHHQPHAGGANCALLKVALLPEEVNQICFEHAA